MKAERLPDYDLNTPISYWITARASLAPVLKALGITWDRHTGTQYQGCKVPEGNVIQLWALWNEGRLMFGPEQDEPQTVASAILQSLKDRINATGSKVRAYVDAETVQAEPVVTVKRKPQRRVM